MEVMEHFLPASPSIGLNGNTSMTNTFIRFLHISFFAVSASMSLVSCDAPSDVDNDAELAQLEESGNEPAPDIQQELRTGPGLSCWEATGSTPVSSNGFFRLYYVTATDCTTTPANTGWVSPLWQPSNSELWLRLPLNDPRISGSTYNGVILYTGDDSNGRPKFQNDLITSTDPNANKTPVTATPPRQPQAPLTVSFRTASGHYIVAEGGGGQYLAADRTAIGGWEQFSLIDLNVGQLLHGDYITLKAFNGNFVVAEGGGGSVVNANRTSPSSWETLRILNLDGKPDFHSGDRVALQAFNQQHVVAEWGGGQSGSGSVNADRSQVGAWETFTLVY